MRFAIYLPTVKEFADVRLLADLAGDAEEAGWDGVFVWDVLSLSLDDKPWPQVDAWAALAAIATTTKRVRIGPIVEAVARRRPWKLARETVSVDRLSNGRLTLGVGLGADPDTEFAAFGEDAGPRARAQKLDEGLGVITKLWSGRPVTHRGRHFKVKRTTFLPRPLQRPRIPIWAGGAWPNTAALRRAQRWDGFIPIHPEWPDEALTPEDYRAISAIARTKRRTRRLDLGVIATYAGDRPVLTAAEARRYADAGVTWWLHSRDTPRKMRATIRRGPPRR